jgi:hypothetical protein
MDQTRLALQLLGLLLALLAAVWLWWDANALQQRGAKVMPALWAWSGLLLGALTLPLYLLLRFTLWHGQIQAGESQRRPADPDGFLVSCGCGRKRTVSEVCAGLWLPCACGRDILVPPLAELKLQQVPSPAEAVDPFAKEDLSRKDSGLGLASLIIAVVIGELGILACVLAGIFYPVPGSLRADSPLAIALGRGMLGGAAVSFLGLALGLGGLFHAPRQTRYAVVGVVANSLILIGVAVLTLIGHRLARG